MVVYPQPGTGDRLHFWYALEAPARVRFEIYNVAGEKAAVWEEDHAEPGYTHSSWDLREVAGGVYVYRLRFERAESVRTTEWKKLVVVKK